MTMNRWRIFVTLLLLLGLLGACTRAPEPVAQTPREDAALFGDHDIDAAILTPPDVLTTLEGTELEELAGLTETDEITAFTGEVDANAVLPNAYGTVAFIRNNPNLSANPWMVYLMDQATDTTTLVYGGQREIQSVATTADGNTLLVAMRRTSDPAADFEVYRITISTSTVERLTTTTYHESNVSMSADGSVLVWEGQDGAGRRAVFIRDGASQTLLASTLVQKEPSVSSNGQFIAFIRTLASGNPRAVRYDRNTNTYQVVWGQEAPIELSHPSTSDDGTRITVLEYRPTGTAPTPRQLVRYLNTAANTWTNAVAAQLTDGPRINHPHLARDGDHLTYAWRQGSTWNIFTRRLSSNDTQRIAASSSPVNNYAPYWQMPATPPQPSKRILYDLSHNSHNFLDPSDPNNTGDAWSLGGWRDTLVADGWQVDKFLTGPVTLSALQAYDVFVTSMPRTAFTSAEITAIGNYVAGGGAALFIGEFGNEGSISASDASGDANVAGGEPLDGVEASDAEAQYQEPGQRLNALTSQFGVTLDLTNHSPETTTNIIAAHPINAGNSSYSYLGASSVSGGQLVYLSPGYNRMMATASYQDGCVALIGDTNIWADNFGVGVADNDQLVLNTLQFLKDCPTVSQSTFTLSVSKSGTGSGTVTSSPLGIDCGSTCSRVYESNIPVTLTATPASGSTFTGWSGACTGTGTCTVNMTANRAVTATFSQLTYSITGNVAHSSSWLSGGPEADADAWPATSGWSFDDKQLQFDAADSAGTVVTDLGTEADWVPGDWSTAIPLVHYVPNEVIVGFHTDLFSVQASDAGALSGSQVDSLNAELQAIAAAFASDHGLSVLGTSPVLSVARMRFADGLQLTAVLSSLANDRRVAFVEPNGIYDRHQDTLDAPLPHDTISTHDAETESTHPADPNYGNQRWHYSYVGAQRGWDTQRGSNTVRVAVIDTGYRADHPDAPSLVAPFGEQRDFVANDFSYTICNTTTTVPRAWDLTGYDNDARDWMQYNRSGTCLTTPSSAGSHGTHVIGTIAAAWNTAGGVGLNQNVRIIPLQALDVRGSGTWYDIAQAVLYAGGLAADNGSGGTVSMTRADITNMSLGGTGGATVLANAVTAASNNGTLIIASAGNANSSTLQYPAAYPEVVAVTAIGANGTRASYSSFGSWVELTAPGGDFNTSPFLGVYSTTFNYTGCSTTPGTFCSTSNGGVANYANYQGTSMAAPHVAGIAALYKAHTPGVTRAALRQALRDRAVDWGTAGFNNDYGYGLAHVKPGIGVARANSTGTRRVQLINATTGATVQSVFTTSAGDYTFSNVPNGSYYVLAASFSGPTFSFGATGATISAWHTTDSGWFQNASVLTVNNANRTGINITLGWPGFQPSNGTPAAAAFMHPGYYAAITYSDTTADRWFRIRVPTSGNYRIWTDGFNSPDRCGSGTINTAAAQFGDFDTVVELYQSNGTTLIQSNDDESGRGLCSGFTRNLTAGTYLVKVRAFGGANSTLNGRRTIFRFDPQ